MCAFFKNTRKRILGLVILSASVTVLSYSTAEAEAEKDYTKLPGYVDFGQVLDGVEANVEVYLKGSLLVLAREAVKSDDPELGELLSKIDYVHVQVFPMEGVSTKQVIDKTGEVAKRLEKKGWELTVRVREDDEYVHVYILPGKKDDIAGLVVMAVDEDDEAVFVNVVGNINPAEIGRVGKAFHIDSMDVPIQVEVKGDAKVTVKEGEKKRHD
jgi:hypothetical protein